MTAYTLGAEMILEFRIWSLWVPLIMLTKTGRSDFRTMNLGLWCVVEGKCPEGN